MRAEANPLGHTVRTDERKGCKRLQTKHPARMHMKGGLYAVDGYLEVL